MIICSVDYVWLQSMVAGKDLCRPVQSKGPRASSTLNGVVMELISWCCSRLGKESCWEKEKGNEAVIQSAFSSVWKVVFFASLLISYILVLGGITWWFCVDSKLLCLSDTTPAPHETNGAKLRCGVRPQVPADSITHCVWGREGEREREREREKHTERG